MIPDPEPDRYRGLQDWTIPPEQPTPSRPDYAAVWIEIGRRVLRGEWPPTAPATNPTGDQTAATARDRLDRDVAYLQALLLDAGYELPDPTDAGWRPDDADPDEHNLQRVIGRRQHSDGWLYLVAVWRPD